MDIGVLGTGMVGQTIGSGLVRAGHRVHLGSRTGDNPRAREWAAAAGDAASHGTFAGAAAFGEILFNCTAGMASLDALAMAGAAALEGKILIDVANPLDFSRGMPPTLSVCNTDSLGERIQRAFPAARVVKTLNTVNHLVMVDPGRVPGGHDLFLSGDDAEAKARVVDLLAGAFGWPRGSFLDLGGIESARGAEMFLPLWLELRQATGTADINLRLMGAPASTRARAAAPRPAPPVG